MAREDGEEWGTICARKQGGSVKLLVPSGLVRCSPVKEGDRFDVFHTRRGDVELIIFRKNVIDSVSEVLKAVMKK
jgi:hypothetical protein